MSFHKDWKPNPKQEEFLAIPVSVKEAFYGGGAGSGKSDVLLIYGIAHRWHEHPQFKQVFMRRTHQDLKKEIVPRCYEIYPKFGATFNQTDMVWTFPRLDQFGSGFRNDGARIYLGNCEYDKNVHDYDSMQINLYTPDELTTYSEWIYLYIGYERGRSPVPELPAIIRGAGMPGGIGHTWVKKRFVDPAPEGGKRIVGRGGNVRIYIHSTLEDNKDNIDPTYSKSLEALPEAEKKAKKYGDWDAYLGQVFDEFRDIHYPTEPDNALHVIEPFEIPNWWPKIVVGDWGFAAMTWIGFGAISPNRRLYIYREMYWTKTKISVWGSEIREYIDTENPRVVKFCKSAGQDRGQEHTIQEQISQAIGRPVELTNNNAGSRISGKMQIHEYLRWKENKVPVNELPPYNEELALRIYRIRGQKEYEAYINQYVPAEPELLPKLQIFNTCPVLVNAIKSCNYDKPKNNNKPQEDVAEFDGDDPYDGLRYMVDCAESYLVEAEEEFKKVQAQEAIVKRLEQTQDWTAFYRNQRTLESSTESGPVKRYH